MSLETLTERLARYDAGALPDPETAELFQYLIDTGLLWLLPGRYGRAAEGLIRSGTVLLPISEDC